APEKNTPKAALNARNVPSPKLAVPAGPPDHSSPNQNSNAEDNTGKTKLTRRTRSCNFCTTCFNFCCRLYKRPQCANARSSAAAICNFPAPFTSCTTNPYSSPSSSCNGRTNRVTSIPQDDVITSTIRTSTMDTIAKPGL